MIIKLISHSKCYVFNQTRVTLFGDSRLRSTILFIKGGGQGGSPGEQGTGEVQETGKERAGSGISMMAECRREIQKGSFHYLLLLIIQSKK